MIALWAKIKGWAALVGVALLALGVAFLKGRSEGKQIMEAEQDKRRLESVKQRKEIDDEVAGMDATAVDGELAKWLRDDR